MAVIHEIVLPEAEPAYEWILGQAVQKVSPTRSHSLLQRVIADKLTAWAAERGDVGPEWRFRLTPAGGFERRPLVPDVAYVSAARLEPFSDAEIEAPPVAPELVVEINSPDDQLRHRVEKRRVYLAAGVTVVIEVDPVERLWMSYDGDGNVVSLREPASWTHPAFPGLRLDLVEIFAVVRRKRP